MSITIGSFSASRLQVQPFGYNETSVSQGLSARQWTMSGLLTQAEWNSLITTYDTWRDSRITDEDTLVSESVGTTVNLSGSANGITWSGVACWFESAPTAQQAGIYVQASCTLVDANQAVEVLLRQEERNRERKETARPDLGTVTLGSATLSLLSPMETYQDTPQLQLTASGNHVISGALTATRVRSIQGTTDSTGWTNVRSWYETTVADEPSAGDWFPISAPEAEAEAIIIGGVKTTRYTVTIDIAEVK